MRSIKVITAIVVAGMLSACDDNIIVDLIPDEEGYLWIAVNFHESPPNHTGKSRVAKYDLPSQSWVTFYETPFERGKTYDMACGDGRAWVYGAYWDNYEEIYNYKIWEVGTDPNEAFWGGGEGLAFDGSKLWYGYGYNFRTIDPDTYEIADMFPYTNPRGGAR